MHGSMNIKKNSYWEFSWLSSLPSANFYLRQDRSFHILSKSLATTNLLLKSQTTRFWIRRQEH